MLILDDYENPVSPEDILGTSKEKDSGDEDSSRSESSTPAKSTELKIPEEVQKEFLEFIPTAKPGEFEPDRELIAEEKIDEEHLFQAVSFKTPLGRSVYLRKYYRFQEHWDENGNRLPSTFDPQNVLAFDDTGGLVIKRSDYVQAPLAKRNIYSSEDKEIERLELLSPRSYFHFSKVLGDKTIRIGNMKEINSEDGELSSIHILTEATNPDDVGLIFGHEKLGFSFRESLLSPWEIFDARVSELVIGGQKVTCVNSSSDTRLIFHSATEPDKIDYEITVPKKQEMVDFETGTGVERRYKWEEDLIPEALRKDPMQPPVRKNPDGSETEVDESWKRANLAETLGIKIQSALAA